MKSEIHWTRVEYIPMMKIDMFGEKMTKTVYAGVNTENIRQTCKAFKA